MKNPITAAKADVIRDRFLANAAQSRAWAADAEARGDNDAASNLIRMAQSQERMAQKRYEAMTVRAI